MFDNYLTTFRGQVEQIKLNKIVLRIKLNEILLFYDYGNKWQ